MEWPDVYNDEHYDTTTCWTRGRPFPRHCEDAKRHGPIVQTVTRLYLAMFTFQLRCTAFITRQYRAMYLQMCINNEATKYNNKTSLPTSSSEFLFDMLDVPKKSSCRYWWSMANTDQHKNYSPVSLSRKSIIKHFVKLEYYTLRSSKVRRNSKLTYPDIWLRLCGNHRIPCFIQFGWKKEHKFLGRPIYPISFY
jgi:hypothetical protein